jgi:hypothetical protein
MSPCVFCDKHSNQGIIKMNKILVAIVMVTACSVTLADPIVTDSTSRSYTDSNSTSTTTVKSPPPTAVAPTITSINNDLCTVGSSGAAQTQILGLSFGTTSRDMNCERLKLAKNLYDMGMKVAAVSTLCQDERVFAAMMNAGTPCPIDGKIGESAKELWEQNPDRQPKNSEEKAVTNNRRVNKP